MSTMHPEILEKLTRSALRATLIFHFFPDHPSEFELEGYMDLLMPDLLPRMLALATCDELDDYMRMVIYDVVEDFCDRYRACAIRERDKC